MKKHDKDDKCRRDCGWVCSGEIMYCGQNGQGSCFTAKLCKAKKSKFHDQKLIDATRDINKILKELESNSDGRTLSLITTKECVILVWAIHEDRDFEDDETCITIQSDNEKVINALGLQYEDD